LRPRVYPIRAIDIQNLSDACAGQIALLSASGRGCAKTLGTFRVRSTLTISTPKIAHNQTYGPRKSSAKKGGRQPNQCFHTVSAERGDWPMSDIDGRSSSLRRAARRERRVQPGEPAGTSKTGIPGTPPRTSLGSQVPRSPDPRAPPHGDSPAPTPFPIVRRSAIDGYGWPVGDARTRCESSSWKWWPGTESNHRHADFQSRADG
jgi:hypothetical protein